MYDDYIEGKRELREITRAFNARYVSGEEVPTRNMKHRREEDYN